MPSFCVVSNCEYKYAHADNISFHKFPFQSPNILAEWIKFTDRGPNWTPSRWSSICSRHFLPSDFRDHVSRKCLKRLAKPTMTIKNFDIGSIQVEIDRLAIDDESIYNYNDETSYKILEIICRLCARTILDIGARSRNIDDSNIIQCFTKCFPNIRFEIAENFPNKICVDCLAKLKQFSIFVDKVQAVQNDLLTNISTSSVTETSTDEIIKEYNKPIIIKQEPIVNVKQEVLDFQKSTTNHDNFHIHSNVVLPQIHGLFPENDAFCEFCDAYFINNVELKNHIIKFHSDNPKEIANSCEIMEIINLEDVFIDLAGNSVEDEVYNRPSEQILKVEYFNEYDQRESLLNYIANEHNYSNHVLDQEPPIFTKTSRMLKVEELPTHQSEQSFEVFESTIEELSETIESLSFTYICSDCTRQFDSESSLDNHITSMHLQHTQICSICSIESKTIFHHLIHKNKYHRRTKNQTFIANRGIRFSCADCTKTFQTKLALKNHKRFVCPIRRGLLFYCKYCKQSFSEWILMRQHSKLCRLSYVDSKTKEEVDCNGYEMNHVFDAKIGIVKKRKLMPNKIEAAKIKPMDNGRYPCNLCERSYGRRSNLYRHRYLHRPRDKWNQKCTTCGKLFDRIHDLRQHLRQNCQKMINSNRSITYICPLCEHQFKTYNQLKFHEYIHTGVKPYACETCGKRFRLPNNLHQHKITHLNEKKYHCSMCSKVFKRIAGLNQHIKGFHYNIKPHKCPVCKHSYALKGDMTRCKHSILKNF